MVANVNHISDTIVSSPINRYQQISQAESKIEKVDREIAAREKYDNSSNKLINSYKNLISSNNEIIALHKESKDLSYKRIALLEDTNKRLIALLDSKGIKYNAKSFELDSTIKERLKNLDTKLDKLTLKAEHTEKQSAKLENKSKNADEYTNNVRALGKSLTYTSISRAPSTMPKVQDFESEYNNFHLLNKDLAPKIEKNIEEIKANKSILENYNKSLSNNAIGSRQEEDKIGQIIDRISFLENENKEYLSSIRKAKSQYMDLIKDSVPAKQYTNELIKSGAIKEAQDVCNNIISSKAKDVNSPIVDKNYVPSDEKLRSAASTVMKLQDMFGSKIRSNENLVSSYISAFSEGRASVTKDEVLNMLQNAFVYTNISLKALDKII